MMATEIRGFTPSTDATMRPALTPDVISADRETAYVLWATVHGQNATEVAKALGLNPVTVRSWASRDGWRGRLELEHQEQGRRVRTVVDAALLRVIPRVIERLERIALGQGDIKPMALKDGTIVEVEQPIPPQASVNAAKELLALYLGPRAHHHHHTTDASMPAPTPPAPNEHGAPPVSTPLTREQAAAMTPAERQAWEETRRSRQV